MFVKYTKVGYLSNLYHSFRGEVARATFICKEKNEIEMLTI